MSLSDAIAAQIMGELHALTSKIEEQQERVERVAEAVGVAARAVNSGKSALQNQNEVYLKNQFALLTDVVQSLKSSEELLRQSGPQDARALLAPLIEEMRKHATALSDKQHWAAKLMTSVNKVQNEIAGKLFYATIIGVLLFVGGGALGYILGRGAH